MPWLRQILITLSGGGADEAVLATAAALAQRHDARIRAIFVRDTVNVEALMTPEAAVYALDQIKATEDIQIARVEEAAQRTQKMLGLPVSTVIAEGEFAQEVAREAATADLLVTGQHNPDVGLRRTLLAQERLLIASPAPVLFVPYVARARVTELSSLHYRRVLLAWDRKREAALALRMALPLLREADAVDIVHYAEPGAQAQTEIERVQAYLAAHGVEASGKVVPWREPSVAARLIGADQPDPPVGESLLSHAADTGADLLVMGAYGHSRAWEIVMGGVTQTILRSMTLPVLMMH